RYPAEPAISGREQAAPTERIGFVIASEREKLELLARQLRQVGEASSPPIIFCRNDERAAELAEQLTIRGFIVGQPNEAEADVAIAAGGVTRAELTEEVTGEPGQTISFDVPADAATLRDRHAGDPDAAVLIEPREIAHLREIAGQAGARVDAAAMPLDLAGSAAGLEAFRREIRSAIAAEDLTAQMLVLEPLFDEFTAAEIAAATAALLRRRQPPATRQESATPSQDKRSEPASRKAAAGPAPVTWARLYVGVGSREEIRPGDLVGTLAGEADIPGSQIGKIEILDNFSIVEVQADVAEKVIQAVNGTTIKGRSVRVDYDRGGPARRPPTRGGSPPRRTTRRPPRENG
ncbi:MAG: DbpA RNA binding domain-containing protein, partial [Gemmatimonadota bacterium]